MSQIIRSRTPYINQKPPFKCVDCGGPDMFCMVSNRLWAQIGMTPESNERNEILCLPCIQKRAGRKLTLEDFPEVDTDPTTNQFITRPCNRSVHWLYHNLE